MKSSDGGGSDRGVDRRHQASLVGVAMAVILLAWFALANLRRVRIDFWVFNRQAPLILVIVISGLLGALITALVMRRKPKEPKESEALGRPRVQPWCGPGGAEPARWAGSSASVAAFRPFGSGSKLSGGGEPEKGRHEGAQSRCPRPPGVQTWDADGCGDPRGQVVVPLSDHEQRILAELEESLVRQDPEFAERVRSETVYRHAGRYCKWAAVTFVIGVVILVAFYSKSVPAGFVGVVIMFASAVWFERNLRRMGRAGWHDLTRTKDGESKPSGATGGIEGAVSEARDWFRSRFHRREN